MKARETVMSAEKIEAIVAEVWRMSSYTDGDENREVAKAQAEITWDKAIREVVEWLEENNQGPWSEASDRKDSLFVLDENWQAQKKTWLK